MHKSLLFMCLCTWCLLIRSLRANETHLTLPHLHEQLETTSIQWSDQTPPAWQKWPRRQIWCLLLDCQYLKWMQETINTQCRARWRHLMIWILTFMAEGEPPLFARLNAGHPDVIVVNEADKVGVPGADLGVHACTWTLALNLDRLHWWRLYKHRGKGGHLSLYSRWWHNIQDNQFMLSAQKVLLRTTKLLCAPSWQWYRLLLAWNRKRPLGRW